MGKYCILVLIICISTQIKAQEWTKKDSIWLKKVLSGEERLQLNDETKRAIESGTLLSPDPNIQKQMQMMPAELPVIKSFEGITAPENRHKQPHKLPPPVYKLYGLDSKDSLPNTARSTTFYGQNIEELKKIYNNPPLDPSNKNQVRLLNARFSAEDILRTIFWPSHRAKQRNKKNANTYKTYNNGY